MPVTPAVRSALYRMLAGIPDVHSQGHVRDVSGREGTAISLNGTYQECADRGTDQAKTRKPCTVRQRLVIDPKTGQPLAEEPRYLKPPAGTTWSAPGGLFSYRIFEFAGWTNAAPPKAGG